MKDKIKSIYHNINSQHFVYFLREAEFRQIIKNMNRLDRIETFAILLLKKFNYETYFDD